MPSLRAVVLALALLLALPAVSVARPDPPGPAPPNIVLVLTDDLTADLLPYLPQVQAMQREGMSFDNYIVSNSLCCPSRASLLTGRYPHNTGVLTNVWPTGGRRAFARDGGERDNVALDLQARGYRTGFLGKYLNEYSARTGGVPPGWDTWAATGKAYHGFRYWLNVDGTAEWHGARRADYLTDVLRGRALRFVDGAVTDREPFFLEVSTFAPHGPATPAPRHRDAFPGLRAPHSGAWDATIEDGPSWLAGRHPLDARQIAVLDERFRRRAQSVLAVDDLLRDLQARLQARGIAERTYVVFTSDNGFHLGQYRLMPGKMTAYDQDVRVPLVVTGPGVPAGGRVAALTQNVDLRPTFAELAGARPRGSVDGLSLAGALHGRALGPGRSAALIEHVQVGNDPDDADRQPPPGGNPTTYEAIRFDGGLYVESADGERELYDLRADPLGLRNVWDQADPELQASYAARLDALAVCRGATCRR